MNGRDCFSSATQLVFLQLHSLSSRFPEHTCLRFWGSLTALSQLYFLVTRMPCDLVLCFRGLVPGSDGAKKADRKFVIVVHNAGDDPLTLVGCSFLGFRSSPVLKKQTTSTFSG